MALGEESRMRVMVTGGAGFLGQLVANDYLKRGDDVVVVDAVPPQPALTEHPRITFYTGDLRSLAATLPPADIVIHLAAVVSSEAEADFDLGMRVNLDTTLALLERCRSWQTVPTLVFASSVAVFGRDPFAPTIEPITDDTLPRPQSSYGVQKFIGEQLVTDYTRKGFVNGRTVRLMTVAVRPGKPNSAASSFVSSIIREPLAGQRASCPVSPDTPIIISSPRHTVDALVAAAAASPLAWGSLTATNAPGLTTSPREMAAALDRVAGAGTSEFIDWVDDPAIEAIVGSWPARFNAARASQLGLETVGSFDEVINEYLRSS